MKPLLIFMFFTISCTSIKFTGNHSIKIDKNIPNNAATDSFIRPYKQKLAEQMDKPIGYLDTSYTKNKPNGNLNNLVADLIYDYTLRYMDDISNYAGLSPIPLSFCVLNYGGLRASLPADTIKVRNIYELSPFENNLVILQLNPSGLDSLIKYILQRNTDPLSGLNINSLGHYTFVNSSNTDTRRPIYFVTNDYMANGGDGFTMLLYPQKRIDINVNMRTALISQFEWEYNKIGKIRPRTTDVFTN
jgi:2',3'-cyclic-nucleotide 2'-phosphodiesterase (5'-nucleotidase family)